jgi:hypothetical protein
MFRTATHRNHRHFTHVQDLPRGGLPRPRAAPAVSSQMTGSALDRKSRPGDNACYRMFRTITHRNRRHFTHVREIAAQRPTEAEGSPRRTTQMTGTALDRKSRPV